MESLREQTEAYNIKLSMFQEHIDFDIQGNECSIVLFKSNNSEIEFTVPKFVTSIRQQAFFSVNFKAFKCSASLSEPSRQNKDDDYYNDGYAFEYCKFDRLVLSGDMPGLMFEKCRISDLVLKGGYGSIKSNTFNTCRINNLTLYDPGILADGALSTCRIGCVKYIKRIDKTEIKRILDDY